MTSQDNTDLKKLSEKILSGQIEIVAGAQEIVALFKQSSCNTALLKSIKQAAREIIHYHEQLKASEEAHWQASFEGELTQSHAHLIKSLKKL